MKPLKVAIGFATGRKGFQDVLKSYVCHLKESELLRRQDIELHLFVAYDLGYNHTTVEDYTQLEPSVANAFETCTFLGKDDILHMARALCDKGVIEKEEVPICFGNGYAAQRNAVLYSAMTQKMDQLLFLDDDEYPLAVTESKNYLLWSGQHVLESHIEYLRNADMTNGYHCGYISPIPYLEFDHILSEQDFRAFILALSNDVLNWDSIKAIMQAGGITYADKTILMEQQAAAAEEVHGAKFITGGNLGINLTVPERVQVFYNPPGARGEDTFLSTSLTDVNVKYIPTYTFHDGFGQYGRLLDGVLPNKLQPIDASSEEVVTRFYRACVGWVRYKPLYTYLTQRAVFDEVMQDMQAQLTAVVPKICSYFNRREFADVLREFEAYRMKVHLHEKEFASCKRIWEKIKTSLR